MTATDHSTKRPDVSRGSPRELEIRLWTSEDGGTYGLPFLRVVGIRWDTAPEVCQENLGESDIGLVFVDSLRLEIAQDIIRLHIWSVISFTYSSDERSLASPV